MTSRFGTIRPTLTWSLLSTFAFASLLTGCFQNLSTTSSSLLSTNGGANFVDTGGTSIDGSFDGSSLNLDTQISGVVGSYASPAVASQFGIVINLKLPILRQMSQSTLNDLLNQVDTNTSIQNLPVHLKIPQYGIQATFTFGTIAMNNSKQLRNVMVIRPNLGGVDLGTGYLPDTAPLVQLSNGYIFSYGGLLENTPIAQLSVFYRDPYTSSTGFFPNASNSTWGRGIPDAFNPQANAFFLPLTEELGKIYKQLFTNPSNGQYADETDFPYVESQASSHLLAIHVDPNNTPPNLGLATNTEIANYVKSAYIINSNMSTPKYRLLCSSAQNSVTRRIQSPADQTGSVLYDVASAYACDCDPMAPHNPSDPATAADILETCADNLSTPTGNNAAANKIPYLKAAIIMRQAMNTPSTGSFPATTITSNGVTITPLLSP
jgi:hypothetical protein